jgi:cytochrome c oxidase cbb3-type subunit 3
MRRPVPGAVLIVLLSGSAAVAGQPSAETLELYRTKCLQCHLADGNSPLEPLNFTDAKWTHGSKPPEIAKVIAEGVPGTAMLGFNSQLTPKQIAALAAYVRAFDKSAKPGKPGK